MPKNLNVYYVAISGLQKAVRRGLKSTAVSLAEIAWQIEPYRLYRRLHTILYEDCPTNLAALRWVYDHPMDSRKWDTIEAAVSAMCDGSTNLEVMYLSHIITHKSDVPEQLRDYLKASRFSEVLELREKWQETELYPDLGEYEWIMDLIDRTKRLDGEDCWVAVPLFWKTVGGERCSDVVDEAPETDMLYDVLPACAIDGHTRPGKIAFSAFFKYRSRLWASRADKPIFYWYEGRLRNKCEQWLADFPNKYVPTQEMFNGMGILENSTTAYFEKIKPEINVVRDWVFKTQFSGDISEFSRKESHAV
jgi:hypothetical protein